jgi:hypothetical protein
MYRYRILAICHDVIPEKVLTYVLPIKPIISISISNLTIKPYVILLYMAPTYTLFKPTLYTGKGGLNIMPIPIIMY